MKETFDQNELDKEDDSSNFDINKNKKLTRNIAKLLIKKFKEKLLSKYNIDVNEEDLIGQGTRGVAFKCKDNKVLKISSDESEAIASLKLKGKKLKHVANFYDVFKFKDSHYFGILVENLQELSEVEKKEFNYAITKLNFDQVLYSKRYNFYDAITYLIEKAKEKDKYLADEIRVCVNTLMKYNVDKMTKDLNSAGVFFYDYHAGNIMKRKDGEYVVIDPGYSKVLNAKEVDILESKIDNPDNIAPDYGSIELTKHFDKFKARMKKLGINIYDIDKIKVIGEGSNGIIYKIAEGYVLKITRDAFEIENCITLTGKSLTNVVKVYDVFRFIAPHGGERLCVIEEELFQIDEDSYSYLDKMFDFLQEDCNFHNLIVKSNFEYEKFMSLLKDRIEELEYVNRDYFKEKGIKLPFSYEEIKENYERFKIKDMMKQLKSLSINFKDYHVGNIMKKKNGSYCITDVGAYPVGRKSVIKSVDEKKEDKKKSPEELEKSYYDAQDRALIKARGKTKNTQEQKTDEQSCLKTVSLIHKDLEKSLSKISIKLPPINQFKLLGGGEMGFAYDIGNYVLKMTRDPTELIASKRILEKGQKSKYTAEIYYLFRITNSPYKGIVQEKLNDISEAEQNEYVDATEGAFSFLYKTSNNMSFIDNEHNRLHFMKGWDYLVKLAYKRLSLLNLRDEKSRRVLIDDLEKSLNTLKKYNIDKIIDYLSSVGVGYIDYNPGNLKKKKDGTYAVIDLGVSYTKMGTAKGIPKKKLFKKESKQLDELKIDTTSIDKIYDRLKNNLVSLNIELPHRDAWKVLGGESWGEAFDIGNNKVLKLTKDLDEAGAATQIIGKKLKGIYNVFYVFSYKRKDDIYYGIVQEKLHKLNPVEKNDIDVALNRIEQVYYHVNNYQKNSYQEKLQKRRNFFRSTFKEIEDFITSGLDVDHNFGDKYKQDVKKLFDICKKYNIDNMLTDLAKNKIIYTDRHIGNVMKRENGDYVLIDLGGGSQVENEIKDDSVKLYEGQIDSIGVTIGRYQPFHKGHAQIIRDLASKFTKVIVLVAGNKKDKNNPFPYELRLKIIQNSLPDVLNKLEIYKVDSGFLPDEINKIMINKNSSLKADIAFQVLVGSDRVDSFKKQFELARKEKKNDKNNRFINPDLVSVNTVKDLKNEDEASRISGTAVRQAIISKNKEALKKLLDSHIISNNDVFEELYSLMLAEFGKTDNVEESIKKILKHKLDQKLSEVIGSDGGAMGGSIGGKHSGMSAGSSGWSTASKNPVHHDDDDEDDMIWQSKLKNLQSVSNIGKKL